MRSIDFSSWWGMPAYNLLNNSYAGAGLYSGVDAYNAYQQQKSARQKYNETAQRIASYPSTTTYTKTGGSSVADSKAESQSSKSDRESGTPAGSFSDSATSPTSTHESDRLGGVLASEGKKAAIRAGVPAALGLTLGAPSNAIAKAAMTSALGPGAMFGMMGNLIGSQLGVRQSVPNSLTSTAATTLAGLALGPAGAIAGSLIGGPLGTAINDLAFHEDKAINRGYYGDYGFFGGMRASALHEQEKAEALGALGRTPQEQTTALSINPSSLAHLAAMEADTVANIQARVAVDDTMSKPRTSYMNSQGFRDTVSDAVARGWTGLAPGGFNPFSNPAAPIAYNVGREAARLGVSTYGRDGNIGGPMGGLAGPTSAYGPSMGGWAGLGIGNPSTYGGTPASTPSSDDSGGGNYGGGERGGANSGNVGGGRGTSTGTGGGFNTGRGDNGGVSGL